MMKILKDCLGIILIMLGGIIMFCFFALLLMGGCTVIFFSKMSDISPLIYFSSAIGGIILGLLFWKVGVWLTPADIWLTPTDKSDENSKENSDT